jgi:hypothetical protein
MFSPHMDEANRALAYDDFTKTRYVRAANPLLEVNGQVGT